MAEGTKGQQHRTVLLNSPEEVKPYVHQVMPNQTPEEFEALKGDIREVGIEDPIWLDKDWAIVDGHHRVRAWIELLSEGVHVSPVAANVYEYDEPEKIYERAMKRNLNRRQLNNEQKAELVRNHLKHLAEVVYRDVLHRGEPVSWTTERIAKFLGLSVDLVRRVRREMEEAGEISPAVYVALEDGRRYPRKDLQERGKQAAEAGNDRRDVATISVTTLDGEILEAATSEELQKKLNKHLASIEAEREAEREAASQRQRVLEDKYTKDLADWLETWRRPEDASRLDNIPVEVWEEAIKRAKKNRTEKVEQLALKAAMNASALKEYDPEEVIEYVMQSDMRDMEAAQYEFAAEWYGRAVDALRDRMQRPVRAIR